MDLDNHISRLTDTDPVEDIPTDIDHLMSDDCEDLEHLEFAKPWHVAGASDDAGDDIEPLDLPEFYD